MDGLLVDTEPLWQKAEMFVFREFGVKLTVEECKSFKGIRIDKVVENFVKKYSLSVQKDIVIEKIINKMYELMNRELRFLPGAIEALRYVKLLGLKVAIASSSSIRLIKIVAENPQVKAFIDFIRSGQEEKRSKPAPDIFLSVVKHFNISPSNAIVFEDSIPGIKAAKAAGMTAVAVPASEEYNSPEFDIADFKLRSLEEIQKIQLLR